jgi:hypothetical protein
MKRIFFLLAVLLFLSVLIVPSCKKATEATITGKATNCGGQISLSLIKLDFSSLINSTIYSLDLNTDGSFKFTVPLTEPAVFMLVPGKDVARDVRLEMGIIMSPDYASVPYYAGKVKVLLFPGKTSNVDVDFNLGKMGANTAFPKVIVNKGFKKDQNFFLGMTDKLNQAGFTQLLFDKKDSLVPKQLSEADAVNLINAFGKKMTDSIESTKGLNSFVKKYFKTDIGCQGKNTLIRFFNTSYKAKVDSFYKSGTVFPAYTSLFEPSDTLSSKWCRSYHVFLENRANHYVAVARKSNFKFYNIDVDKYVAVRSNLESPVNKYYLATQIKHIAYSEYDKLTYEKLLAAFKADYPNEINLVK